MSYIDDGGAAFPLPPVGTGDPRDGMAGGSVGMSLRDYFAAKALQNMAPYPGWDDDHMARTAYARADAMLRARALAGDVGGGEG